MSGWLTGSIKRFVLYLEKKTAKAKVHFCVVYGAEQASISLTVQKGAPFVFCRCWPHLLLHLPSLKPAACRLSFPPTDSSTSQIYRTNTTFTFIHREENLFLPFCPIPSIPSSECEECVFVVDVLHYQSFTPFHSMTLYGTHSLPPSNRKVLFQRVWPSHFFHPFISVRFRFFRMLWCVEISTRVRNTYNLKRSEQRSTSCSGTRCVDNWDLITIFHLILLSSFCVISESFPSSMETLWKVGRR